MKNNKYKTGDHINIPVEVALAILHYPWNDGMTIYPSKQLTDLKEKYKYNKAVQKILSSEKMFNRVRSSLYQKKFNLNPRGIL